MTTNQNDELIAAAVMWWANHLGKLSVEGINGDDTSMGSAFFMYAKILAQKNDSAGEAEIKKFMELLTEHLQEKAKAGYNALLGTDYCAEGPLGRVCDAAKVSSWHFPQKTTMWINFDKGTVTYSIVRGASGQVYPAIDAGEKEMA